MPRMRVLLFLCACLLIANAAGAQDGWMEWIEKMSGPGPWYGGGPRIPLVCWNSGNKLPFCIAKVDVQHPHRPEDDRHMLQGGFGFFRTFADEPRFENTPNDTRPVHLTRIDLRYYFRPSRVPSLDVGGGLQFWRFSGEATGDFTPFWQPGFTGSAVFTPLALLQHRDQPVNGWLRVIKLRGEASVILGLTGDKFNNPAFEAKEVILSAGLIFDFLEVIRY